MSPATRRLVSLVLVVIVLMAPMDGFRHNSRTFARLTRLSVGSASVEVEAAPVVESVPVAPSDGDVAPVVGAPAVSAPTARTISVPHVRQAVRTSRTFHAGWYDSLQDPKMLREIARERTDSVLPYDNPYGDVKEYLDAAHAAGLQVYVEIPRDFVKNRDRASIGHFVSAYRSFPALAGWYLADEPSTNKDIGRPSPHDLERLYNHIKAHDPVHPVAIDFAVGENAHAYTGAMDVMMFDDYPCGQKTKEYDGLTAWTAQLVHASHVGLTKSGWVPVIQAFEEKSSMPLTQDGHRLPTDNEERYMVFTAIQSGATGVFFWTHYRSNGTWIGQTLMPITSELTEMKRALGGGEVPGEVESNVSHVIATAYRDGVSGVTYVITVNRSSRAQSGDITLTGDLQDANTVTPSFPPARSESTTAHRFSVSLPKYGVQVFQLVT